jgi:hypothetical protein
MALEDEDPKARRAHRLEHERLIGAWRKLRLNREIEFRLQ